MILFDKPGREHTPAAISLALEKAAALDCSIVVATYSGQSARLLVNEAKKICFNNQIIAVRVASTAAKNGINPMSAETKKELENEGVIVVTAAHALSAGERGISSRSKGIYPLEIMADTLRTFGQGTKVCFECSVMALDADVIPYGQPVVALGGTGGGEDTALVITPSYSSTIMNTVIHEILCKPSLYKSAPVL